MDATSLPEIAPEMKVRPRALSRFTHLSAAGVLELRQSSACFQVARARNPGQARATAEGALDLGSIAVVRVVLCWQPAGGDGAWPSFCFHTACPAPEP